MSSGPTPQNDPHAYITPQVVPDPPLPAPPRRSAAGKLVFWAFSLLSLGGLALLVLLLVALVSAVSSPADSHLEERYHSLAKNGGDKVAIITVSGAILDGDGFVKKQIDKVRDDEAVKAVVLRVDSPGGTVTASDYLYHHLKKLREERKLPLVVSMGGLAASGGYYVSMAAGDTQDVIFAEPSTWTGSIGVVIPHYNFAGLARRFEVSEDSIKSHPLKQMGSPLKEMTDEERKIFQGLVDESFADFKEIVKSGRPRYRENPAELDKIATGQVFTTRQAIANGLVDKQGFIEDAIDRAIALAGLDKSRTKVVKYKSPFGLFDGLFSSARSTSASDLQTLIDLTSPRAYYLCTWLPTPVTN